VAAAAVVTPAAARALLAGLVDYAGLFPPAALGMDAAVTEYARWRRAPEAFMLGRFVAPAGRLVELGRAAEAVLPEPGAGEPWRVSALLGADLHGDTARVASWNVSHAGRAIVDSVELKAASPQETESALDALAPGLAAYVELPLTVDFGPLLAALKRRGARAKLRTGGVVPEAIPEPVEVARFIVACAAAGVPFKATAGLHHPVRAEHALSYEPDSPRAVMHGFLNVFAAAAFARDGLTADEVEAILREDDPSAFRLDDFGLEWRGLRVATDALTGVRRDFASSFGSCSFAEPVADLRALEVLS
jgi:hypothetical protein